MRSWVTHNPRMGQTSARMCVCVWRERGGRESLNKERKRGNFEGTDRARERERREKRSGNISAGSQRGHFLCTLTRHIPALRKNSSLFVPMRPDSREALRTISSPFGPTRPDSREEGKRTATVSETSGSCLAENISACTQPFSHSPVPRATASNNNTSSSAS